MSLTLLLDLDDTLITNRADSFVAAYLKALGKHLKSQFNPEVMAHRLLAATKQMVDNDRPDRTLEQVFDLAFYPSVKVQKGDLAEVIDQFYREVFPTLQPLTSPRPEAIRLVEQAFERGYSLAVATNPLFPRTAILQRLAWAGMPVDRYPFKLVTSYETFHFAKPNPAYYAEVLAQLGWPSQPAIMVGNDPENDAIPAAKAGIHTYLLVEDRIGEGKSVGYPNGSGRLDGLLGWLEGLGPNGNQPDYSNPDALLAILKSTPAAICTLSRNLPASSWNTRPQPGEWSIAEICCHLRDVEREVHLPRLQQVFQEENPFLPAQDTDRWAEQRQYLRQNGYQAASEYLHARIELLELVNSFHPSDWDRPARHSTFGKTNMRELVSFTATHDRNHIQQIHQVAAAIQPTAMISDDTR